ncbi:MAG TPA: enoyl-CoA hydratase-related protein [Solirubrobacteraceae bacterium]|nr:enoyl-CoA hydratase-related protein [Solirubrobacteraceae bacterium]
MEVDLKMSYDSYSSMTFERLDDVLRVTLANPRNKVNAVDGEMHADLVRLFEELKTERSARAVILTGSGRAFSAGGDFAWMSGTGPEDLYELRREGKQIIWNLLDVEIPLVAAINGPAVGLGATLALLCDAIFIADTATVADPHVRVGIVAGDGGAVAWPLAMGPVRAKRYLLTGDPLTAPEAEQLGLVNAVVEPDRLQAEALAFARRLAAGAPLAVRYTKLAVNQLLKQAMATAFDYSTALELVTFASADHAEALRALAAKETPRFNGT